MPLAVFITSGQRQADYETSFNLLKQAVGEYLFEGQHYPKVFITDDSLAEQNTTKSTFPESRSKLCLFHVAQAVWRWLWNSVNKVAVGDSKTLMQDFQSIMRCSSVEQAELTYKETCGSPTSKKYGNWKTYLQSHWERRELRGVAEK
jgi:transposase-like protein